MRGHGTSASSGDLAFDDLVADTGKVLEALIGDQPDSVEVFLIGHSLGASILAALPQNLNFKNEKIKFSGLVMVDIIEGTGVFYLVLVFTFALETAVNSLNRMPEIIKDIPKSFKTIDIAVDWTLSSSHSHHNRQAASKHLPDIQNSVSSQLRINSETGAYEWIADLSAMAPFWDSWFVGLTKNFLNFSGSRLLILADTDYMDKEMIVAQMQGKFQLAVVRESGHVIQEDRPEELAEIVCGMIQKHLKLSQLLRNKH